MKQLFLEIPQNPQENICAEFSLVAASVSLVEVKT